MGDAPVLAEGAAQVAARKTRREYLRAGPEMVEGLFFDGVKGNAGDQAVEGNVRRPVPVEPDPALAFFAAGQKAALWAEAALQCAFAGGREKPGSSKAGVARRRHGLPLLPCRAGVGEAAASA